MTQTVLLIVAAVLLALMIVWILRARSNQAGHHVDGSVTAVGAASEAARNVAEEVAETFKESSDAEVEASGARADDVSAVMSNAAALMTSSAASIGAVAIADIGDPGTIVAADNLRLMKGVGPKLASLLAELGVTRFEQIAAWDDAEIARIDSQLGNFKGRIARDGWVEQCRFLAAGDVAGFEARFGKIDSPGNR